MAREAGAKKVYFASCSPPITHPHIYGIDLASSRELIAHERDRHGIAKHINADAVIYQTLPDLEAACAELSPRKDQKFEVGVFNGKYVTPVSDEYLRHLDSLRNGDAGTAPVSLPASNAVLPPTSRSIPSSSSLASCAAHAAIAKGGDPLPIQNNGTGINDVDLKTEEAASGAALLDPANASPPIVKTQMDISLHNLGDYLE